MRNSLQRLFRKTFYKYHVRLGNKTFEKQVKIFLSDVLTPHLGLHDIQIDLEKYKKKELGHAQLSNLGIHQHHEDFDPHLNVRAQSSQGKIFLKFFPPLTSQKARRFNSVQQLLKTHHIKVPEIVYSNTSPDSFQKYGCGVVAIEWIEGETLLHSDLPTKQLAFINLAKIHQISSNNISKIPSPENLDGTIPFHLTDLQEFKLSTDFVLNHSDLFKGFSRNDMIKIGSFLDNEIKQLLLVSPNPCLILFGYNPRNVILSSSKELVTIDFEGSVFSGYYIDLCDALIKFVFGSVVSQEIDRLNFQDFQTYEEYIPLLEAYFSITPKTEPFWTQHYTAIFIWTYLNSIQKLAQRSYQTSIYSRKRRMSFRDQAKNRLHNLIHFMTNHQ